MCSEWRRKKTEINPRGMSVCTQAGEGQLIIPTWILDGEINYFDGGGGGGGGGGVLI